MAASGHPTFFYIDDRSRERNVWYSLNDFVDRSVAISDKIGRIVSETNPEDRWFFRVREMKEPYEINIESDWQNNNRVTAFINFRILDETGQFLGVTGVGLGSDNIFKLVEEYKRKFNRDVIFYDREGNSSIRDPATPDRAKSLHERSIQTGE